MRISSLSVRVRTCVARRPVYRESREEDLCKRTLRIRTAICVPLRFAMRSCDTDTESA